MSRTFLWILIIVFLPIAGIMGLVTYIELSAERELKTAFYVILIIVWYIFLSLFFSATTSESSLPNRIMSYPFNQLVGLLSKINTRFYTAIIVTGVLTLLYYWAFMMPVDYMVLVENYSCKPGAARPVTLWPGIFTLIIGFISLNHAVYGEIYLFHRDDDIKGKSETISYWIKYFFILIAVVFSVIALYRLGSLSLFKTTAIGGAKFVGYMLLIIAALAAFIFVMGTIFSFKQKRINKIVMAEIELTPVQEREEIISMINNNARENEYLLMHCRFAEPDNEQDLILFNHYGGTPYLENVSDFPKIDKSNEVEGFIMQVRLSAERLSEVWLGRLITVYLNKYALEIRSYEKPSLEKLVSVPDYESIIKCLEFGSIAIPFLPELDEDDMNESDSEEYESAYEVTSIIKYTPGLEQRLDKYSKNKELFLTRLIEPALGYDYLDIESLILEGGDPVILQNSHNAFCPVCNKKMRFLFQFGDMSDEFLLGDEGQGYVYGCDDHPEQCEGFIDCL